MILIWNIVRFLCFLYSIVLYAPPLLFLFCGNRQHSQNCANNYAHLPISSVPTPVHKYSYQFLVYSSCVFISAQMGRHMYILFLLYFTKNVACYNCSFTHCFFHLTIYPGTSLYQFIEMVHNFLMQNTQLHRCSVELLVGVLEWYIGDESPKCHWIVYLKWPEWLISCFVK